MFYHWDTTRYTNRVLLYLPGYSPYPFICQLWGVLLGKKRKSSTYTRYLSISLATANSPPSPLSLGLSRFELTVLSNQRKAEHGCGNNRHERHRRINAKGQDTTRSGIIEVQVRSVNSAYRGQGIVRPDGRGSLCKGPVDYVRGLYYFYFLLSLILYCYFEQ